MISGACGREVPKGGLAPNDPKVPRIVPRREPIDLIPADLDLVVRIDLARMQGGFGLGAAEQLSSRTLPAEGEEVLRAALARADVVWIGTRLADVLAGDRVIVVDGPFGGLMPDPERWKASATAAAEDKKLKVFDRVAEAPRNATARIILVGERTMVFVTPAEVSSVARVLRQGPDETRGDPAGEGLLSADLRPHRLPPLVERRFPSISAIVAGLSRVRATVSLVDAGLRLDAEVVATSPESAAKALRFLQALRDNVRDAGPLAPLAAAELERAGSTVRARLTVPPDVVLSLLRGGEEDSASNSPPEPATPPRK